MLNIFPYEIQYLIINYLQPEEVILIKDLVHTQEFTRYFNQDAEHIKIFKCKQEINKELENNNIDLIEDYLSQIILRGLLLESEYDPKEKKMNIITKNDLIVVFMVEGILDDFCLEKNYSHKIFKKAYGQIIFEKLTNLDSPIMPNIKTLDIVNLSGFNSGNRCTQFDRYQKRLMLRKFKNKYHLENDT